MLILSHVCAEFRDRSGQTIFTISPRQLQSFMDAPESIREDPLFELMIGDGSLEAVHTVEQKRQLEDDPTTETTVAGKRNTRKPSETKKTKVPEVKSEEEKVMEEGVPHDNS